jgi:hypothetical protein
MPIVNVVDRRKHKYRFLKINAVVEAAWHHNSCQDSDQVEHDDGPIYQEKEHVTLENAIAWAAGFLTPVTLYIYDWDDGLYASDPNYTGPRARPQATTY